MIEDRIEFEAGMKAVEPIAVNQRHRIVAVEASAKRTRARTRRIKAP
jgi:hypothetical protein